jgi:ribosomal-protein-alanine N-acetyltransferase
MEIKIEEASISLIDKLYCIEKKCFEVDAFSKNQIALLLKNHNSISLAAHINSELVGFILGQIEVEQDVVVGHIINLDIAPNYQRKGVAQKLMQRIELIFKEKGIKQSYLEVRENNTAALNLYQKYGYEKVTRLKHYYPKAHGLYLRKNL